MNAQEYDDFSKFCHACGSKIYSGAAMCPNCGARQYDVRPVITKSKVTAALLALFLGGIGAHKFYLGKVGHGILSLFFFWTLIPGIIRIIEFFIYLAMSEEEFTARYG
jgi:TM2 domain-containing membrane protein YozV